MLRTLLIAVLLSAPSSVAFAAPVAAAQTSAGNPPYRAVGGGKYVLTRAVRYDTKLFGTVVLAKGYRSNGSSSPIRDTHRSRMAGFLHDALYASSNRLRFPNGLRTGWSKADADTTYCRQLRKLGVRGFHRRANCMGARRFAGRTWRRLAPKRAQRWVRWRRERTNQPR